MKPKIATIAFGLFCTILCAPAATQEPSASSPVTLNLPQPKIQFDRTVYDFGKTSQVETVSGTFHFQNTGQAPLKMGKPSTSCGCTVAGVKPEVLQPGEKGELAFTMNLGRSRALLQKQITVECNDPVTPKTVLTVKADYTPLFEISPANFFVNLRQGTITNLIAHVTRTDGKPFKLVKLAATQPWIDARFTPDNSSSNSVMRIELTLKPDGAARYLSDLVNGYVEGSDQPAFSLPISGRLTGDLILSPESLYWPITDPTKVTRTRRILVTSALPERLELKNLSSSLKEVTVKTVEKEDGTSVELVAELVALPDQTVHGAIQFETNVPSQPKVELPVFINVVKRASQ